MKKDIQIAYSPDSDDLFMFYAILENKIDTKGYTFNCVTNDTEQLNTDALNSDMVDITAISTHNYAYLSDRFLMLPHGGSVGNNYGPVLVSKETCTLSDLKGKKIAIPGLKTTAYLVLKLILEDFDANVVPIEPFMKIFDEIENGNVDAGLVIHEGRLTYETYGMKKIIDIGEWWFSNYNLPLPLGGNIIRRGLGEEAIEEISSILRESIRYGLDNKKEVIEYILANDPRPDSVLLNKEMLSTYLDMYANEQTFDYGGDGQKAIQVLLDAGYEKGIIPNKVHVEFAP